jgi:hypothetical protein
VMHVGEGKPPAVGRRSSGGRRLGGREAVVCSGGGRGGNGGVGDGRRWAVHMGVLKEVDGG